MRDETKRIAAALGHAQAARLELAKVEAAFVVDLCELPGECVDHYDEAVYATRNLISYMRELLEHEEAQS